MLNLSEEWPNAKRNKKGGGSELEFAAKETVAIPIWRAGSKREKER